MRKVRGRYPSDSEDWRNHEDHVALENVILSNGNKLDRRSTIDYTFTTTNEENIKHSLNYKPKGFIVIRQNKVGQVYSSDESWAKRTKDRVFLQSEVSDLKTTILFL